jgi:phosphoenolpyruvate synthase/pyruvate phosphate dikinase
VNVDASDSDKILECIKSVYNSINSESIDSYVNLQKGKMFVIIQEMISADFSGVMLTSVPHDGYDYMLIEYTVGDLCYLMQGEITPLTSYIKKADIIKNNQNYCAYPSILTDTLTELFYTLAKNAILLEVQFSHRLEIEWGIKDGVIYIYQARPY